MRHTLKELTRMVQPARVSSTLLAFSLIALNGAFFCGDYPDEPPSGGGRQTEPRQCQKAPTPPYVKGADSKWSQYGLDLTVSKPACPITMWANNATLQFGATVKIPASVVAAGIGSPYASTRIYDLNTQQNVAYLTGNYANVYDPTAGAYKAELVTTGQPGISYAPPAPFDRFQVTVTGLGSFGEQANGAYDMAGEIENTTPDLLGPTSVTPNTPYSWRLRTEWDTAAYVPMWKLDGSQISSANQLRYSMPIGTHTLVGTVTRDDNSVASVSMTVNAQWTAQISGPTSVPTNQTGSWQVTAPGGIGTYSYVWKLDSQEQYGFNGATYYHTFYSSGGPHYLQVTITDAAGHTTGSQTFVTVQ